MSQIMYRVRQGDTYAGEHTLHGMECPICGVVYAIPQRMQASAYTKGNGEIQWFCPNGHKLGYHGKSEAEKAQEEADRQRRRAGNLAAQRDQALAEARGQKAAKTRFKNERDRARVRAAAGMCPCCNRTFKQLSRHMKSQHPGFPPADGPEHSG